jgi:hypothetical protein
VETSKEQRVRLLPKTARYLLFVALPLLLLVAWVAAPGVFYANAYAANDAAVLRAALEHFAKHEQYLARLKEAKTLIVVSDQTEGAYPYAYPEDGRMKQLVSQINYWSLRDRNGDRVSLRDFAPGKDVAVVDDKFPTNFGEFEKEVEKKFPGTATCCRA